MVTATDPETRAAANGLRRLEDDPVPAELLDGLCPACGREHEGDCRELRDAWWSCVRDRTDGSAYRWARTRLALDDGPEMAPARAPVAGHAHGWARVGDANRCIRDYHARGERPDSGCGAT